MSEELATRLQQVPIFSFLSPEECRRVASLAKVERYHRGAVIFRQGSPGDKFYVILSGQVQVWARGADGKARVLNYHTAGDFFGELALFTGKPRTGTVDVMQDVELATFDREAFEQLLNWHPRIGQYLRTWGQRRISVSNRPFPGKQWDEVAVAFARKHWIAFIESLRMPGVFLVVGSMACAVAYILGGIKAGAVVGLSFALLLTLWLWWLYIDWINDDYIVTTKRVIHIERVLFVREERHEAPLEQIQDVTTETMGALARILDFRDLVIHTAGLGLITFARLPKAERIRNVIFQVREAALERRAAEEKGQIRQAIRENLGLSTEPVTTPLTGTTSRQPASQTKKVSRQLSTLGKIMAYLVPRLREEEDNQIIWRKHWLILLKLLCPPLVGITLSAALLTITLLRPNSLAFIPRPLPGLIASVFLLFSIVWYFWRYDGWRNEVYIITDTRVIDVVSSPFRVRGETRREGTFDAIQTIYYDIPNFFARLINLGNVYIDTAGTSKAFTFEEVYNPSGMQEEIFHRLIAYNEQAQQEAQRRQREELSEWFRIYHQETGHAEEPGETVPPVE